MNAKLVWHDPVVAEIHQIRNEIAEKYHHDLDAIAKAAEEKTRALGFTVASPEPRTERVFQAKAS
jgi:hypothetical protein